MKVQYQVTAIAAKYKPVSCILTKEQSHDYNVLVLKQEKEKIIKEGVQKICGKRGWTPQDLVKMGYTQIKVRKYDKALIDAQNRERYEKLKEEKFASGEWKPTKKQLAEMVNEKRGV